jgi:MerR family copper efflux transcriptional regulator
MNGPQLVRVGVLARQAGIPVSTIHYYVQQGLLRPTARTSGGYHLFDPAVALPMLRRIRDLQQRERLRLAEIRERLDKEEEV